MAVGKPEHLVRDDELRGWKVLLHERDQGA
jgi:hypothetical protein